MLRKLKRNRFFNRVLFLIFNNISFLQSRSTYRSKIYQEGQISEICKISNSPWDSYFWLKLKLENLQNLNTNFGYNRNFAFLEMCFNLLINFKTKLKIIDFGGGGGIYFEKTKNYLNFKNQISAIYYLIDTKKNISICRNKLRNSKNCKLDFVESNSFDSWISENNDVDIILLSAVLQYLDDWKLVLKKLLRLKPKLICFLKLPIAEFAHKPARVIQNVKTKEGYCGPTMLTLFPPHLLKEYMLDNKCQLLLESPDFLKNKDYFKFGCEDIKYNSVKVWNYVFMGETFKEILKN